MDIIINLRSTASSKWEKYKSHINTKKLKHIAAKGLAVIAANLPCSELELSVLLTDDAEMQDYNVRFRSVDKPTNVLSFPSETSIKDNLPSCCEGNFYLGDIALGFTTVAREAEQLGAPLHNYTYFLFVHGLLHLFGYVHDKKKDREHMESLETTILKKIGIDAQNFR